VIVQASDVEHEQNLRPRGSLSPGTPGERVGVRGPNRERPSASSSPQAHGLPSVGFSLYTNSHPPSHAHETPPLARPPPRPDSHIIVTLHFTCESLIVCLHKPCCRQSFGLSNFEARDPTPHTILYFSQTWMYLVYLCTLYRKCFHIAYIWIVIWQHIIQKWYLYVLKSIFKSWKWETYELTFIQGKGGQHGQISQNWYNGLATILADSM
jgi:hypothetical protein